MRYESEVAELLSQDVTFKKGHLREECLLFSLSHAYQFDHLLIFLDELCDFARMRTLEPTLQSCILVHLADLTKIFSSSRLVKLFNDVACFLSWLVSSGLYSPQSYTSEIENCMKVLFDLLPQFPSAGSRELYQANIIEEWSEAVRCLGKSEQGWLLDLLQISEVNLIEANGQQLESVKKIQVKSRLVQTGSVPFSELGKLKAYMLNCRCEGQFLAPMFTPSNFSI
nr:protein RST1 isoform X2 [Ipomoea batatas]